MTEDINKDASFDNIFSELTVREDGSTNLDDLIDKYILEGSDN